MNRQLPGYGDLPSPLLIAREDEALTHGQVMYGLIKPTKDMDMVESTAAMVNVIPKKRIYRMEDPDEVDLFMAELMKRPLVIQPSAYIGRGLSVIGCTLYTREERWIMLVNQAHPKIRSRIQLGIEAAKAKMHRGEPFILEISFNAFLKRNYLRRITKSSLDERFTIIDFEDAEIVIRYPGDRYHRGMQWELKGDNKIRFEFEDLLPSDVIRRTVMAAQTEWSNPALRVIMPDELFSMLPGWGFENKDPFEGVEPPEEEDEESDEGAAGGYDPPGYEEAMIQPPPGKVVGRAKRKANKPATIEVPIELHNIRPNVHNAYPSSPNAKTPSPNYEKLNRTPDEHPYSNARLGVPSSPSGIQQHSPTYENSVPNKTPYNQQYSPYGASSPRTPHTPVSPHVHNGPPRTPIAPMMSPGADRYNEAVRPTQQTYLTDDDGGFSSRSQRFSPNVKYNAEDDGGFSSHSPHSPRLTEDRKYDTNFNETGVDRYGNQVPNTRNYNPRDRYGDNPVSPRGGNPNVRPGELYMDSPSQQNNPQPANRPVPPARGFHRYQGSGRSDTSTSDSGFGETDNGHESSMNRNNGLGGIVPKTPYYNHAYEQDSPEAKQSSVVDDIMAKHKALAEKMMSQQNSGHTSNRQDKYNDSNYTRQLQHWRQNINDLEKSCEQPDVNFSRSRLRVNSQGDQVDESFI